MKKRKISESQLKKIIRNTIKEQQGTPWCSYCISNYGSLSSCQQCNSSFNKDNITCQQCKNLFPGNGAYPQGLIDDHCNQVGQPCHDTQTQWKGGKGQAKGATQDDMQAKKGPTGKGGRRIKVSESELIKSIEKIIKEQSAMLGFGNMGGLSLGVSKPTDKYELGEDAQDTNTSSTINVNYMDQNAANQSMEDWEMGEDYSIEKGSHGHPHEMDEDCGDGEMHEGCGDGEEMYEDSGAFESNYFNSLQGIRTSDVYKESRVERLVRKNLKETQKKQIRKWSR